MGKISAKKTAVDETTNAMPGDLDDGLGDQELLTSDQESAEQNLTGNKLLPAVPTARQGDSGRPFCELHNCLMESQGSTESTTNYGCPVPHCKATVKKARPLLKIPRKPQLCPMQRCQEGEPVFLEVDKRSSSVAHLAMRCPNCKEVFQTPRPEYLPHRKKREEDLSER